MIIVPLKDFPYLPPFIHWIHPKPTLRDVIIFLLSLIPGHFSMFFFLIVNGKKTIFLFKLCFYDQDEFNENILSDDVWGLIRVSDSHYNQKPRKSTHLLLYNFRINKFLMRCFIQTLCKWKILGGCRSGYGISIIVSYLMLNLFILIY